jgi:hypothetical protein
MPRGTSGGWVVLVAVSERGGSTSFLARPKNYNWQVVYQPPITLHQASPRWRGRGFGSAFQGVTMTTVQVQTISEREDETDQDIVLRRLIRFQR